MIKSVSESATNSQLIGRLQPVALLIVTPGKWRQIHLNNQRQACLPESLPIKASYPGHFLSQAWFGWFPVRWIKSGHPEAG
jgi:hypothetical protein